MEDTPITKFLVIVDDFEIKKATKIDDLVSALWDFDQWLRAEYKYNGNEAASRIREEFQARLSDYGINIEDLMVF